MHTLRGKKRMRRMWSHRAQEGEVSTQAGAATIKSGTQDQSNEDKDAPIGISDQQSSVHVEVGAEARCSGLKINWEERCEQTTPLRSLDKKRRCSGSYGSVVRSVVLLTGRSQV